MINEPPRHTLRPDRPRSRLSPRDPHRVQDVALIIIAFAVVLFLLVQARFLLISLVTAIVIFSLMSDAINFIARARIGPLAIPNWLASVAAVVAIAALLLTLTSIVLAQINTVLITTLSYVDRAPEAIAALFSWLGENTEAAVLNSVQTVEFGGYIRALASQAGNLMQGTVLVILFVGFLFAERVWFSTKLVNFVGDPVQADRVGRIIGSIIRRVNRYLAVKTLVSLMTGVMVWALAGLFGLELAVALGILTFILNYIPNIGSIVATALVALVAYVQLGDPATTGAIFAITGAIQFINGNVLDPMMMGRALRLSSFGIIISLAFWGAVWGIPGMFLSVPITVAAMIVCSEIPALRPIAILLSREGLPEPETEARDHAPRHEAAE
ncbi:LOW QUALITY PROTEIN: transporter, permease [Limimaricola cinnabarinus LL-001]|uniref:Transporter, permease n=1 Tax=Limimaricola cinnabarinus LL-001 TaxID=1337093 RepID=U2Z319_9RHOB|nr:LOW QUALITY PROTEIN: transporter, permease [Limimaricola cinnabarinus LL-001]